MKTKRKIITDVVENIKPTEFKQLTEKEYKKLLKDDEYLNLDNKTINEIWERAKRGRK